jgi:hypothetical protein
MLDADLAELYGVSTRNSYRFPPDFMFELTKEEYDSLRSQIGTLKRGEHSKYGFHRAGCRHAFVNPEQQVGNRGPSETPKRKIGFRRERWGL